MRACHRRTIFLLALTACILACGPAFADVLDEIRIAIEESGAEWTAGRTAVSDLSMEEMMRRCGHAKETPLPEMFIRLEPSKDQPVRFDWRDIDGNDWMSPIRDQGACGACTSFASLGALETLMRIYDNDYTLDLDLSEQHIMACTLGSCDFGLAFPVAMSYLKNSGAPDEACFPYVAETRSCSESCADWQTRATKIADWGYTGNSVAEIKEAVMAGPLVSHMVVYEDFGYYQSGTYDYAYGARLGGHAVDIVGWINEDAAWICRNSWSEDWGINGYFKIRWNNQVELGSSNILMTYDPTQQGSCALPAAAGSRISPSAVALFLLASMLILVPLLLSRKGVGAE